VRHKCFPEKPEIAIVSGFKAAEDIFLKVVLAVESKTQILDQSGSCAVIALIVDDIIYIAHTGDS